MKRLLRIGIPSLALAAALALPAVRAGGSSGCHPRSWMDWHVAVRQQCLEPRYVCEHMTSAEMLRDPQIAAAWREGIAAGSPEPARGLSRMVRQVRGLYGCEPEGGAAPGDALSRGRALPPGHPPVGDGWSEALPPGHPPVGHGWSDALPPGHPPLTEDWAEALPPGHPPVGGGWSEALPPGHPPLGGTEALPPGHPPLGGTCPFGGSGAGRARHPDGPLPFTFEQPEITAL